MADAEAYDIKGEAIDRGNGRAGKQEAAIGKLEIDWTRVEGKVGALVYSCA